MIIQHMWRNQSTSYGIIAISFHWIVAALFLGNLALGTYMSLLKISDPDLFSLFQLHKSFGVLIFVIVIFRLLWRFIDSPPPLPQTPHLPQTMKKWEVLAAKLTHIGLYAILVAMPLSGWIIVSASPIAIPTYVFSLIPIPHIGFIEHNPDKDLWLGFGEWSHWLLAWSAGAGVFLHVAAALRHHFILKDGILQRMLPSFKKN